MGHRARHARRGVTAADEIDAYPVGVPIVVPRREVVPFPTDLDPPIKPLVRALWKDYTTLHSCCGHGRDAAYVQFSVLSLRDLLQLAGRVQTVRSGAPRAALELELNPWRMVYAEPDRACVVLRIWQDKPPHNAPTPAYLKRIAALYSRARAGER